MKSSSIQSPTIAFQKGQKMKIVNVSCPTNQKTDKKHILPCRLKKLLPQKTKELFLFFEKTITIYISTKKQQQQLFNFLGIFVLFSCLRFQFNEKPVKNSY